MKIETIILLYLTAAVCAIKRHSPPVYEETQESGHRTEVLRRTRQSKIQQTFNPHQFDVKQATQQDQQKFRYMQQQSADLKNHESTGGKPRPQSYSRQERVVPNIKEFRKIHDEVEPTKSPFRKEMSAKSQKDELDSNFSPSQLLSVQIQTKDGWKVVDTPSSTRNARSFKHSQLAFINNNEQNSNERMGKSSPLFPAPITLELLGLPTLRPLKKVTIKEENVTNGETILTNIYHHMQPVADKSRSRVSYQVSENAEFGTTEEHEMGIDRRQDMQQGGVIRLRVRKARKQGKFGVDQKATASVHGFPLVNNRGKDTSASNMNYVYLPTGNKQMFHSNIHALNALIGQQPQQQLQGLHSLLGAVQSQDSAHFQSVPKLQYFELKDHTPITENVQDVVNPESRPNVKIEPSSQYAPSSGPPPEYFLYKPHTEQESLTGFNIQKALFSPEAHQHTTALIQSQAEEFALKQAHVRQQLKNVQRAQELANAKIHAINEESQKIATRYHVKQRVKAVEPEKKPEGIEPSSSVSMKSKWQGGKLLQGAGKRSKREVSSNETGDDYEFEYYEYDYDSDGNDTEVVYYDYLVTVNKDDQPRFEKLVQETTTVAYDEYDYDSQDFDYPDVDITSTTEATADRRYIRRKSKPKYHRHKPHRNRKRRPSHRHRYNPKPKPKPKPYYPTYSQVTPEPFYSFPDLRPTYHIVPTFKPTYHVVTTPKTSYQLPSYNYNIKPSLPSYAHKSDKEKEPTNVIVINNSNDNHNHGGNLHHAQYSDVNKGHQGHSQHYAVPIPHKKGNKGRRKRVKKRRKRPIVHSFGGSSTKHIVRITKKVDAVIHKLGHVSLPHK